MEVNTQTETSDDAPESGGVGQDGAPTTSEDSPRTEDETPVSVDDDAAVETAPAAPPKVSADADLIRTITKPISEGSPCGDDAGYDDDFQRIKSAIEQATLISGNIDHEKAAASRDKGDKGSIVGTNEVDYDGIVQGSRSMLATKTKDLRLASYLAIGLFHTRNLTGLLDGIAAMNALNATYWEGLYPDRPRARRSAVDLMVSRVGEPLEHYKPVIEDGPVIDAILEELDALQSFLAESLGQNVPVLSGIKATLASARRRVPVPVKKVEPRPSVQRPSTAGAQPAQPAEAPEREMRSPADARRRATEAAEFLRSADKKNPLPYRIARVVYWSEITTLPSNENGKTLVDEPDATKRQYLEDLFGKGVFETLLEQCESVFSQPGFFLWLNLQRIQATAAAALGEPYAHVYDAILVETAALIRRVPGLMELRFIDDKTPFVDPLTRDWIETTVLASTDGAGGGDGAGTGDSEIEERFAEARKHLGKGDLPGALAAMDNIGGVDSDEKRFRIRLYRALLCVKGGQSAIACPILESLDGEVDRRGLAAWDPKLALEVWTQLYRCYENMSSVPGTDLADLKTRAKSVYNKICEVDASSAFAFTAL